ncbi:NFX1-type zinc finger-containing protein 1 [Amyelois transitella]|uniref:NFX1-type zinc finger-containing protein 1 n=1 Tax=Amyelois transitella TaxID=680683 RepID=UPI00067AD302|nr:NFX1-type zinc finger-containing protein 1 [Amyelois transitella]XP_060803320.1 NFX1-type zinc finger-containing protein 1 [Amyelois transitella]
MEEDILPSTSQSNSRQELLNNNKQGARPKICRSRPQKNTQNAFFIQGRPWKAQGRHFRPKPLTGSNGPYNKITGAPNRTTSNEVRQIEPHKNHDYRPRLSQFDTLEALAICEDQDILGNLNQRRNFFTNLFLKPTAINKPDIFVLILKILSKVCLSSFDDLKLKLLISICNDTCVMQLRNYLSDLPDCRDKTKNSLYWKNQHAFWKNFILFLDTMVSLSPSIALKRYRSLICKDSRNCLNELNAKHAFKLPDEDILILEGLQEKLFQYENQHSENKTQANRNVENNIDVDEPPENFRELPVIPNHHHLMRRPYLRPNIVEGEYQDVEHYLDVQFRLLQEDCYGPLRKGIIQYLEDPTRGKFDNIRVYKNIKFRGPYVSESKVGVSVAIDHKSNKRFFKINWASSKRLLYGSLVVISKDNFKRFIVATVLERDEFLLSRGLLPVCIINNDYDGKLSGDETYTMIESEVYFEPYYHVLKVFQGRRFPQHLAMQDYIVKARPLQNPPKYLTKDTQYEVTLMDHEVNLTNLSKFTVLNEETWPSADQLGLNESQYQAYKLALTHEFTVIQGPPGTGKTYIGTKIAQTLLKNLNLSILVVCYTNHALDQFLENILSCTDSIARVGNRSKNKAMEELALQQWRKKIRQLPSYTLYKDERENFRRIVNGMKQLQKYIESLDTGLLSYSSITPYVPDSHILRKVYINYNDDIITNWLFERLPNITLTPEEEEKISMYVDVDTPQRSHINLDEDLNEDIDVEDVFDLDIKLLQSFSLDSAYKRLKYLKSSIEKNKRSEYTIELEMELATLNAKIHLYKAMRNQYIDDGRVYTLKGKNVARMSNEERWSTYFSWTKVILNRLQEKFNILYGEYEANYNSFEDARMNWDREVLQRVRVIGMTTTGAARMHKTLQELKPAIVIVEEAAEVLEQHITSSLTSNCQHLILIGDHQQLRPSAAYMKLAREYNIEVSLFERMIKNNVSNTRLSVQHRMRPEIASLIVPHIYQELANHPEVENKPNVRGVLHNVFFLSHNFLEQEADEGSSRTNRDEADIALGLANYLIQQDYAPTDITILAAYSGQMFYMKKQRNLYRHLSNVKITVVDNYQGEESKIIILSLVRNNMENKIGFLSTENRVCVALSRAKEGFFMIGNIDILRKNSELWEKIASTLENMGSLGISFKLKCEIHPIQVTTIETVRDFEKVPEGGCLLKCGYILDCNHICPQICHVYDRAHKTIRCAEKCERVLCEFNHVCPKKCKDTCGPCMEPVEKRLPCGHDMFLPCHQDPGDEAVKCLVSVHVTLPNCGHEVRKPCHMNIREVKCIIKCIFRVQRCGHVCMRSCHVTDDPDHEKYVCYKPCAKANRDCTAELQGDRGQHQCPKICYETCDPCNVKVTKKRSTCKHSEVVECHQDVNATRCPKKCARMLPCGHFCRKKCYEKCGDCSTMMVKRIPDCNHEVKIECGKTPSRADCTAACDRMLDCGHPCPAPCNRPCLSSDCKAFSTTTFPSPCGHQVRLPCSIAAKWTTFEKQAQGKLLLQHCAEPCNQTLQCDHACSGTCSQCLQGRIHMPCNQTCQKTNVCGHRCEEPCSKVCPPCNKPCEISCDHSKCNKPCGSPCSPCQEKCTRSCPHGACVNRCGEPCSRAACAARCARALPCGHACRGLCGEPCPNICKLCKPDSFPKDFLGDDYDDDARFIQLQDCPHVLEVDDMDNLMMGDLETVSIRACPFCRKSIINTHRYKDLINTQIQTDINHIKRKIFGDEKKIQEKREECSQIITNLANIGITVYTKARKVGSQIKRNASLLDLEMKVVYFNILEIIGEYYSTYANDKITAFMPEILEEVQIICQSLIRNPYKVSEQMQADINGELNRMSSLITIAQVVSHPTYKMLKHLPEVESALATAQDVILTWQTFDSELAKSSIRNLQKILKQSNAVVTQIERQMIVKAMGATIGHWFKCPNGHCYYIGNCGGATQIGKCNECGEAIGGTNHRLLSSNRHNGEIDGSQYPAWSEQANMANYEINF